VSLIKVILAYRGFILGSIRRDFQSKYRNSILGISWTVLNPLAMIMVYTIVFSQVMRARLPEVDGIFAYSIYLCAGILAWGLFAEIVSRSQNVFIDNASLIKKISFPRICLPIIVIANALINFGIIFGIFSVFLVIIGDFPGIVYLAIFPLILILILFSVGLGIILGVFNVFFRDIGQFFSIFLQIWFWLTPIVYPLSIIPQNFKPILQWNPMAPLIGGFQVVLLEAQWPNWGAMWLSAALALFLPVLGFSLFRKHVGEMVDEL
jgi:lipopolysaccharide transport system permease protein